MVNYMRGAIVNHNKCKLVLWPVAFLKMKSADVKRGIQLAFILVAAALLCPPQIVGQGETTSAIVGKVSDSTGAAVPGATVNVKNRETGAVRAAQTDDAGRFNFPQLKPGSYSVIVEAPGFEPKKIDNVVSGLGQKQSVDFTLKVARASETVEVSAQPGLINPEDANTSTNLDAP